MPLSWKIFVQKIKCMFGKHLWYNYLAVENKEHAYLRKFCLVCGKEMSEPITQEEFEK